DLVVAHDRARHVDGLALGRAVRAGRRRGDLGRLIAQRARYAAERRAALRVLARLLAADDGRVRVEALARRLRHREIDLRRHRRANAVEADYGAEQPFDAPRVLLLDLLAVFELRGRQLRRRIRRAVREQRAGLIDDDDARRRELGHARRDEVHDGLDLRRIEPAA